MKLVTEFWAKPIPQRYFDWSCVDSDSYDGPPGIIGYGKTEAEAVADWRQQFAEACGNDFWEHDCRYTSAAPVREDALADKRIADARSDDREP